MFPPSTVNLVRSELPPPIETLNRLFALPGLLVETLTPGSSEASCRKFLPFNGRPSIFWRVMTPSTLLSVGLTSVVESPEMTTVSEASPTSSATSSVEVTPTWIVALAMLVLNPFAMTLTSYSPGRRLLMKNSPLDLELTALSAPVCLFFTVTTASEMIAFAGSVTEPCKAPVGVWAGAATAIAINKESGKKILTERFIWFLLDCEEQILRCEERKRAVEFPPSIPCKLFEPSASPQISVWKKSSPTALSIRGLFIQLSIRWRIKRTGNGIDGTRGIIGNVAINRKP